MKLRNPSIQIGAVNIKDDYYIADALDAMLKDFKNETKEQKQKRREQSLKRIEKIRTGVSK